MRRVLAWIASAALASALVVGGSATAFADTGGRTDLKAAIATASSKPVSGCQWNEYQFVDGITSPESISLKGYATGDGLKPQGYVVYRKDPGKKKYRKIATVKKAKWAFSYKDRKVKTPKTYSYKFRAYRTIGGRKAYGPFSDAVRMSAVYRTGKFDVCFLTERNTVTDSLVMRIASKEGNAKLVLSKYGTEYWTKDFSVDIGLVIDAVSSDGKTWKPLKSKKVPIAAGTTKYIRFVPSAYDRKEGVTSFRFFPDEDETEIDMNDASDYNGFETEFLVDFNSPTALAAPNGECYH